jgi:hypothetical protein
VLLAAFLALGASAAEMAGVLLDSASTISNVPGAVAAGIPPTPSDKNPVDAFRELLSMNPGERKRFLAERSAEDRRQILAKVREYETLSPNQRELRLRATELRWYLRPLMSTAATNRAAQLSRVPPEDRQLVADRLLQWDKLPAPVQRELLANEATLHYFTEVQRSSPEQRRQILSGMSPARRLKLEAGVREWRSLSPERRRELTMQFNQFFDLTAAEKSRALTVLSDAERKQIEKTLRSFGHLPREQRAECIRSFEKFASLSLEERQQFLKNAERWKLMSPDQRQAWRDLVAKLPPPFPTEVERPPHPASQLPPTVSGKSLTTNN